MYKVLIIDDEEPLREAIRILGDWKGLGVEKILEATDGRSGLAMLQAHKIDLVMVDMKMPEMDGLEFLQIAQRDYPDLFTIVISGYNDFEFTRQAIRSKVVDYLVKPVNRQDLNQALYKALSVLEAKRRTESEFIEANITLNMSLPKLKEKIYLSIIGRSFKKHTSEALLPLIGAGHPGSHYAAGVLRLLNLEQVRNTRFNKDTELLHFAAANVINEIAGENVHCFSFASPRQEREMIAVYTMKNGYADDLAFQSVHLMKRAAAALNELFGIHAAAAVGGPFADANDIAASYESAKAAVDSSNLLRLAGGTAFAAKEADPGTVHEIHTITSRIPGLRSALEAGNPHQAKRIVSEYTGKLKAAAFFSLGEADRAVREFVILMIDIALELGVSRDHPFARAESALKAAGISGDLASFDQFEALLHRILDFYSDQIRQTAATNRPFDAALMKDYIDNHYFEDIKISLFTEKYFLSREYLMKLFKQQFGYGIHEYIQKIRMDKAKELLSDPSLKIQEISEMLGYKDKNYFSKAFRNYYSESPTEYRMNRLDG